MAQTYYQILGVSLDAPDREIKRAYYALAARLHPDKAPDPESRRRNEEELAAISEAYNVLKDPAKRREYDARLEMDRREQNQAAAGGGAAYSPPPAAPSPASAPAAGAAAPAGASPSSAPAASTPPASGSARAVKGQELVQQRASIAERAFAKGMQHFNLREFEKAVPFFEAAIQNDDTRPQYHIKLAVALIRSHGSYTRAVEHAQIAIQRDPYNVEYKLILGEIHETAGGATAARKQYEDALRWDPNNAEAKNRLAMLGGRGKKKGGASGGFLSELLKKIQKK